MNPSRILEQVKGSLGHPVIQVHTPDESIKMFEDVGLNELHNRVSRTIKFSVPPKEIVQLPKEEIVFVVDCQPYRAQSGSSVMPELYNDFTLSEAVEFFNINVNGILTPILMQMEYNQLAHHFNFKYGWKYDRHTGELYSSCIPKGTLCLAVEAKAHYTRETLTPELETWLYKYVLANTKIVEGRIRSKFKDLPGAPTDGDALIAEGNSELALTLDQLESFIPLNYGVSI